MKIKDYSKNGTKFGFACPSEALANIVFDIFRKIGYKWASGEDAVSTHWKVAREDTWYYVYPRGKITHDDDFNYSCLAVNIFEIEDFTDAICKDLFVL